MTDRTARASLTLASLRAISLLVPRADRAAWFSEWQGEFLHHFATPAPRRRVSSPRRRLSGRLGMALRHAWWLRTNPPLPRFSKGGNVFDSIRLAARSLRREPSFTLPAILTLALGIGANIAVFSVLEAVLLRPLPYPSADRLVLFQHRDLRTNLTKNNVGSNDVLEIASRSHSFEAVVPYGAGRTALYGFDEPVDVYGIQSTEKLFDVAGTKVAIGRGIETADTRQGAEPVVVLGHDLWQKQFKGDPGVVGRSLKIGSTSRRVVGIAPAGFNFPPAGHVDIIAPLIVPATPPVPRSIGNWVFAAGRLRPGVRVARADAEMRELSAALGAEFPATNKGTQYFGLSVRDAMAGDARRPLLLLMGAVSVVLVIALVNVGNLLLVRSTARSGELALRAALGAGRRRIFAQLLTENLLLTGVAAAVGALLAHWGTAALVTLIPPTVNIPALAETGVNGIVLIYAAGIALVAGVLFSVFATTYNGGKDPARAVVSQTRHSMSRSARRTSSTLVVVEVALAVILLVGAGLILRSFSALLNVDAGFSRTGVSTIALQLPAGGYNQPAAAAAAWNQILPAIKAVPNVSDVGVAAVMPLTGNNWTVPFARADRPLDPGQRAPDVGWQVASRGYFEALKIPLRSGRLFEPADATGPPVVIISESIERKYFDTGDGAVGHRVTLGADQAEIVGVVGDIRRASLTDSPRADMYMPAERQTGGGNYVFIRTANGAPVDSAAVRNAVRGVVTGTRVEPMITLGEVAEDSAAPTRLVMWLLGVFSGVSLLLAAVGIYGVLSYTVRQRLREFATRMALGATSGDIHWLVMRQGAVIVGAGLTIGIGVALIAAQTLQSLLFSVTAHDPSTVVAAGGLLVAATILGCYLPARRAARAEPARSLSE